TADTIKDIGIYLLKEIGSKNVDQSLIHDQNEAKKLIKEAEKKCCKHKDEQCHCGLSHQEIEKMLKTMKTNVLRMMSEPKKKKAIKSITANRKQEVILKFNNATTN